MRSIPVRLLSAFLALWLAFMGGLAAVRPCPVHDGVTIGAVAAHGMPMRGMPMEGMPAPGTPAHHTAHQHGNPGQPSHDHGGHGCTCIGTCCASATLLPPTAIDVAFVETLTPVAATVPSPRGSIAPTLVEHARPPSIGPPTLPA